MGRFAEKSNLHRRYEDRLLLVLGADEAHIEAIVMGLMQRGIANAADRVIQNVSANKSSEQLTRLWIAGPNMDDDTLALFQRLQRLGDDECHQIFLNEGDVKALPAKPGKFTHAYHTLDEALSACLLYMQTPAFVVSR